MNKNQLRKIADRAVQNLDANDFEDFMREIPEALEAAMKRKETVEKQPNSVWDHYWNWRKYIATSFGEIFMGSFLVWMIAPIALFVCLFCGANSQDLTFNVGRAISLMVTWTLIWMVLPITIHVIQWRN